MLIVDPRRQSRRLSSPKCGRCRGKPVGILLTHGHFDHILAVEEVKKEFRHFCLWRGKKKLPPWKKPMANLSAYQGRVCSLKADVELSDLQEFEAAGFTVKMIGTPGHTEGSSAAII